MKLAYLVFAYKNPRLLQKTIEHLSSENSSFFVHIDRKSNIEAFSAIRGENVFFSETRLPVYWAEFSGVRAIELLIRQALAHAEKPDYLVLLSGSEFPLRSSEYIEDFFRSNRGAEFITLIRVPNAKAGKPLSRINTPRIQSHRPIYRQCVRALAKLGLAKRDYRKH